MTVRQAHRTGFRILLLFLLSFNGVCYGQNPQTVGELRVENIYPLSKLCASVPSYCARDRIKLHYNDNYQITVNDTLLIEWVNAHVNPYDTASFITWPDTLTKIATTWQIDTTSTRVNAIAQAAIFWPDTLTKIATKYQLDTLDTNPGGTGTQIQYRNGTNLGGVLGSSWNGITLELPLSDIDGATFSGGVFTQLLRPSTSNTYDIGQPAEFYRDIYLADDIVTTNAKSTTAFVNDTSVYALIKKHAPATTPAGAGTELQYRNGSAFGAVSSSYSGGNLSLTSGGYFQPTNNVRVSGSTVESLGASLSFTSSTNFLFFEDNFVPQITNTNDIGDLTRYLRDLYLADDWNTTSGSSTTAFIEDTSVYALIKKHAPATTPAGVGTELQYKNGSSFGALSGSSVSGANMTVAGNILAASDGSQVVGDGTNQFLVGYFDNIVSGEISGIPSNLNFQSATTDIVAFDNFLPSTTNAKDLGSVSGPGYWKDLYLADDWNTTSGSSTTAFIEDTSVYALIKKHAPVTATPNLDQVIEAGATANLSSGSISITTSGAGTDVTIGAFDDVIISPQNILNVNTVVNSAYKVVINDTTLVDLIKKYSSIQTVFTGNVRFTTPGTSSLSNRADVVKTGSSVTVYGRATGSKGTASGDFFIPLPYTCVNTSPTGSAYIGAVHLMGQINADLTINYAASSTADNDTEVTVRPMNSLTASNGNVSITAADLETSFNVFYTLTYSTDQ